MIKAVLFDWDRTLADTLWLKAKLARMLCKKYGVSYLLLLFNVHKLYGKTTFQIIQMFSKEQYYESIIKDYVQLYKEHAGEVRLFDATLLSDLKAAGLKIGIVTNDIKENTILTCGLLNQPYDVLVSYQDVKNPKPDPEPLLLALRKLKVRPTEAMYVGDHPQDMHAAKAAGVIAVGKASLLAPPQILKRVGADHVVYRIKEVKQIIEKLISCSADNLR